MLNIYIYIYVYDLYVQGSVTVNHPQSTGCLIFIRNWVSSQSLTRQLQKPEKNTSTIFYQSYPLESLEWQPLEMTGGKSKIQFASGQFPLGAGKSTIQSGISATERTTSLGQFAIRLTSLMLISKNHPSSIIKLPQSLTSSIIKYDLPPPDFTISYGINMYKYKRSIHGWLVCDIASQTKKTTSIIVNK